MTFPRRDFPGRAYPGLRFLKRSWRLAWVAALAILAVPAAFAQADVALVNRVSGVASYASPSNSANPVTAFMRVREGDRFTVASGAMVRVVYMQGGRQEAWTGPASFVAGERQSTAVRGTPAVTQVPVMVAEKMGRIPNLMQSARLGGVTVRGGPRSEPLTAAEADDLRLARDTYRRLRADAPQDDVAPELFLYSVLQEYSQYDELRGVAKEMLRRQPDSAEVRELADWAESRASR